MRTKPGLNTDKIEINENSLFSPLRKTMSYKQFFSPVLLENRHLKQCSDGALLGDFFQRCFYFGIGRLLILSVIGSLSKWENNKQCC